MTPIPQPHVAHVALVTGANHGIGAATARRLAADGCAVLASWWPVHDEPDPGTPEAYGAARGRTGEAVVEAIRAAGGRAHGVEADLSDPASAAMLFDEAERVLGPVDILVNNASGWTADTFKAAPDDRFGRSLKPVSAASFDQVMAVDGRAAALLIAEFARRHAARGASWGRIVGLTSGGAAGFPEEVSYGAAKAAQESLTLSAAQELRPLGVTANLVHPPVTDTGWVTDAVRDGVGGRVAAPDDVAEVIAWLAGDGGRWVTGNIVRMA